MLEELGTSKVDIEEVRRGHEQMHGNVRKCSSDIVREIAGKGVSNPIIGASNVENNGGQCWM